MCLQSAGGSLREWAQLRSGVAGLLPLSTCLRASPSPCGFSGGVVGLILGT